MARQRPHDTPAGANPDVRNLRMETLSAGWFTLRRATFDYRRSDGSWHEEQREAYDRGNGAVALLHDPDRDTVLLVRQYRLPVHVNGHPDGMLLEAPAGLIDDGEGAADAMRRELEEEVGHRIASLTRLWTLYMSPGSVTEHLTFFLGRYDSSTREGPGGGDGHDGEDVRIVELTLPRALAMIESGEIADAKTVLLLHHLRTQVAVTALEPTTG